MERIEKGQGIRHFVSDYCVLDLETTGIFVSSAKIVEVAAIRIRDNKVVEEFSSLVNPKCHIPAAATAVNNITDDMVATAPTIDEIIDAFIDFLGDDVIVGYNIAGFDMNIIYDLMQSEGKKPFNNDYIDLLHMARRCINDIENYRLETVSKYFSLDTTDEHRALNDCYLTDAVYQQFQAHYKEVAFSNENAKTHKRNRFTAERFTPEHFTAETLALQELQTLLESIIEDGEVSLLEFSTLKTWMEDHKDLRGNYPFDRVFYAIDKVLADGLVSPEELDELQVLFADFVDPVSNMECNDDIETIEGKHIVVTGEFEFGSRDEVCAFIESAGGIIDKSVKKATDYVVVGANGSDKWKTGNYGSKIQKALQMKDQGSLIEIVKEHDFMEALQLNKDEQSTDEDFIADDNADWKQEVRDMLDTLVKEFELPVGSLYMTDNYGQAGNSKDKVISHTVCIWEPSYPPLKNEKPGQNKIVMTISLSKAKSRPFDIDLYIRDYQAEDLHEFLPVDAEMLPPTKGAEATGIIRVRFDRNSANLVEYIRRNTIYCIDRYDSKADSFGCCSAFIQCSDARKCVHENKLYSKACQYRRNLEAGRIFYGKNRNID